MQKYLSAAAAVAASPIAPEQLSDLDGEPRIRDLELANRLGFTDPHKIRALIGRNKAELETYGGVSATVAETPETPASPDAGGRPGREYWLNEGQALVICALSRKRAAAGSAPRRPRGRPRRDPEAAIARNLAALREALQ